MSALGQKPTCALQNLMSAYDPIATAKGGSRKRSCPLYPRKQTRAVQLSTAELSAPGLLAVCPLTRTVLVLPLQVHVPGAQPGQCETPVPFGKRSAG
jgi:hypothetical protein